MRSHLFNSFKNLEWECVYWVVSKHEEEIKDDFKGGCS